MVRLQTEHQEAQKKIRTGCPLRSDSDNASPLRTSRLKEGAGKPGCGAEISVASSAEGNNKGVKLIHAMLTRVIVIERMTKCVLFKLTSLFRKHLEWAKKILEIIALEGTRVFLVE